MKRVVIIDNYDSFTYNLVQAVAVLADRVRLEVLRNDKATAHQLASYEPTHLIVSPGPGRPADAGNSKNIIAYWAGRIPILGVCLGHQCIAEVFGGQVVRADRCMHGKTSMIHHDGRGVFADLPSPFCAMRYHSLTVEVAGLAPGFVVTARTDTNEVMGIRNESLAIEGVQFHPESFGTAFGGPLLANFLRISGVPQHQPTRTTTS